MDSTSYRDLPPGDPVLVDQIVCKLKSQGIFDRFRRDCLADVDTKPAYHNLRNRVNSSVNGYLSKQEWKPDLNKNQLRESLRKHIQSGNFLDVGVERIVDQVVNPKISHLFLPQVIDVVNEFLGIKTSESPEQESEKSSAPQKSMFLSTHMLPSDSYNFPYASSIAYTSYDYSNLNENGINFATDDIDYENTADPYKLPQSGAVPEYEPPSKCDSPEVSYSPDIEEDLKSNIVTVDSFIKDEDIKIETAADIAAFRSQWHKRFAKIDQASDISDSELSEDHNNTLENYKSVNYTASCDTNLSSNDGLSTNIKYDSNDCYKNIPDDVFTSNDENSVLTVKQQSENEEVKITNSDCDSRISSFENIKFSPCKVEYQQYERKFNKEEFIKKILSDDEGEDYEEINNIPCLANGDDNNMELINEIKDYTNKENNINKNVYDESSSKDLVKYSFQEDSRNIVTNVMYNDGSKHLETNKLKEMNNDVKKKEQRKSENSVSKYKESSRSRHHSDSKSKNHTELETKDKDRHHHHSKDKHKGRNYRKRSRSKDGDLRSHSRSDSSSKNKHDYHSKREKLRIEEKEDETKSHHQSRSRDKEKHSSKKDSDSKRKHDSKRLCDKKVERSTNKKSREHCKSSIIYKHDRRSSDRDSSGSGDKGSSTSADTESTVSRKSETNGKDMVKDKNGSQSSPSDNNSCKPSESHIQSKEIVSSSKMLNISDNLNFELMEIHRDFPSIRDQNNALSNIKIENLLKEISDSTIVNETNELNVHQNNDFARKETKLFYKKSIFQNINLRKNKLNIFEVKKVNCAKMKSRKMELMKNHLFGTFGDEEKFYYFKQCEIKKAKENLKKLLSVCKRLENELKCDKSVTISECSVNSKKMNEHENNGHIVSKLSNDFKKIDTKLSNDIKKRESDGAKKLAFKMRISLKDPNHCKVVNFENINVSNETQQYSDCNILISHSPEKQSSGKVSDNYLEELPIKLSENKQDAFRKYGFSQMNNDIQKNKYQNKSSKMEINNIEEMDNSFNNNIKILDVLSNNQKYNFSDNSENADYDESQTSDNDAALTNSLIGTALKDLIQESGLGLSERKNISKDSSYNSYNRNNNESKINADLVLDKSIHQQENSSEASNRGRRRSANIRQQRYDDSDLYKPRLFFRNSKRRRSPESAEESKINEKSYSGAKPSLKRAR